MTSTYTDLGIELMVTGANDGTWGTKTNTNLEIINQMQGYVNKSIAGGAQTTTLLIADGSTSSSDARNLIIELSGKTAGGTGPTFSTTDKGVKILYSNGTNIIDVNANLSNLGAITTGAITSEAITATGNILPGANDTYDLGASGNVWQNVYTGDLHLNNEHKTEGNVVDGSKGSWTLQEGSKDIYLINNKSNEKFRLKLEKI